MIKAIRYETAWRGKMDRARRAKVANRVQDPDRPVTSWYEHGFVEGCYLIVAVRQIKGAELATRAVPRLSPILG